MLIKRIFDIGIAILVLVVLLPVLILAAILILITMPGSVLFRQERIGRNGLPFTIYKFRSMKVNQAHTSVTTSTDSRITPFGLFLRQTKIDELPQLFNILKGEMSIVGPRPDVPGYYDTLKGDDSIVLSVRPGLTGLDSMFYPREEALLDEQTDPDHYYNTILWPHKVRLNRWYGEHWSFGLDMKIVFNTASLLLFGKMVFKINVDVEGV